jgi:hypothetical protein
MAIEFLHGRPLEPEEPEMIRQQIESGFDDITEIDRKFAALSSATGRNCWPNFRPTSAFERIGALAIVHGCSRDNRLLEHHA